MSDSDINTEEFIVEGVLMLGVSLAGVVLNIIRYTCNQVIRKKVNPISKVVIYLVHGQSQSTLFMFYSESEFILSSEVASFFNLLMN